MSKTTYNAKASRFQGRLIPSFGSVILYLVATSLAFEGRTPKAGFLKMTRGVGGFIREKIDLKVF